MYHLKTGLGTFWVIDGHLGLDECPLAKFKSPEEAVVAVSKQNTGDLNWDSQTQVCVPQDLSLWSKGQPKEWLSS